MTGEIHAGSFVIVTDASGKEHPAHARSGIQRGDRFPVIWVCFCGEDECDGDLALPWPVDAVEGAA